MDYFLQSDDDGLIEARITIEIGSIVLHSRSGASKTAPARNPQYDIALTAILDRLAPYVAKVHSIYLDSEPARLRPESERLLADTEAIGKISIGELRTLVRRRMKAFGRTPGMPKGQGNANKRLRIETDLAGSELLGLLRAKPLASDAATSITNKTTAIVQRLPSSELRKVKPEHIEKALHRLTTGDEATNFADSTDYDVLTPDGRAFAPKKVFGLALEEALEIEAMPGHFSAGWGTPCFDILEDCNLWIVAKRPEAVRPPQPNANTGLSDNAVPASDEERVWIEGNPRMVRHLRRERKAGLAKAKREEFKALHGELKCESCGFQPKVSFGDETGDACIEVHHAAIQVSEMEGAHETKLSDLKCLCANCHRVLHRRLALGRQGGKFA
ncbi:HNH endonuclease [Tsuneonella sp. HG249]